MINNFYFGKHWSSVRNIGLPYLPFKFAEPFALTSIRDNKIFCEFQAALSADFNAAEGIY